MAFEVWNKQPPGKYTEMTFGTIEAELTDKVVRDLKLGAALTRLGKRLAKQAGRRGVALIAVRFSYMTDREGGRKRFDGAEGPG